MADAHTSISYIVGSGDGYFVRFVGDTPEMVSLPMWATRMMTEGEARGVMSKLETLGFASELVVVTVARFR